MFHNTAASLIVLVGLAGNALVPPAVHALAVWEGSSPASGEGQHQNQRITVQLFNRGGLVQQIRFGDRTYTLMPHARLSITAPEGTEVYALDKGFGHAKGQLLFTVHRDMQHTVTID